MKIFVKVKPSAKENKVQDLGDNQFSVRVKAHPAGGKANQAIKEVLAEYLSIPKSHIVLLKGAASNRKVFKATIGET